MADYAFRTMEDRQEIEKLWESGKTPREISGTTGVSIHVVYKELTRGQDGTRLPNQRLRYSAELAQRRVQAVPGETGQAGRPARQQIGGHHGKTKGNQVHSGRQHADRTPGRRDFLYQRGPGAGQNLRPSLLRCDTRHKGTGRGISTHNHLYFHLDGAKEFCQKIIAGEIDLEAMRAEIAAEDAAREQEKVRAATERAKHFRDKLEAAGISYATLLDLWAAHDALVDGLAHNILIGWERGEGWPSGT